MSEETAAAYEALTDWMTAHQSRGAFFNGDFAPEEDAEDWVEELVSGMVAAMADAGEDVRRGPVRTAGTQIFVKLAGEDFMARDVGAEGSRAPHSVERILARFARVATDRGCAQRWYYFYEGDPAGVAYFVTPDELKTSAGVDVRDLHTAEQWYEAQPD